MKKSLETILKDDIAVFRGRAAFLRKKEDSETSKQLSDNFYLLECRAGRALKEIRYLRSRNKDPEMLPGLFEKCKELCSKGALPDENAIVSFFEKDGGLNGFEIEALPLAISCSLIDYAAEGAKKQSVKGSKQLANSILSLRKTGETDFEMIAEKLYKAEPFLRKDEVYRMMDEHSKSIYRKKLSSVALKEKKSEIEIAESILKKSSESREHIGKYLLSLRKRKKNGYLYLLMEIIMPFAVAFCISVFLSSPLAGVLLFLPLWEILRYPIEAASMKTVLPKRFLRLSENCERVKNAHALLTVSIILPSADNIGGLEKHLEQLYLSNCTGNIKVCCLADLKSAGMPRKPEDKAIINAAKNAVDRLNAKYSGGFIFAVRPRVHSETQNEFIGRERKRGAITELIRAIKGNRKGFSLIHGDASSLNEVKYLIALDADTQLVFDSASELIAIAEHPLNRPVIKNGRVVSGYGILVPKTENRLKSKSSTVFGMLMAGDSGISAYDSLTGERYQDLFGEGIFCGKGLIDVDTYYALLDKGLPDETILSHDIIESGYLRAGFVPEIRITEGFPKTVMSYYKRLHRWVRGDWQNIRFVFGKNPMNFISRYKIFDNLRRSINPVIGLLAVALSVFYDNGASFLIAFIGMLAVSARNLYPAFSSLFYGGFSSLSRLYFSKTLPSSLNYFVRAFISFAFSAREGFVCADAIIKAVWRLCFSKKKLLEWTTAAQSEGQSSAKTIVVSCLPSVAVSFFLLVLGNPLHRLAGLIILADIPLVLFSSNEIKRRKTQINSEQKETLISYASAMWGFFEDLCTKENNFLPPDNIQFSPVKATANRTSPTNIGLMLASFLSARDMGLITTAELYMRLNLSLTSIEKLEKYKGNLLNWYSTQTLQPLNPRFVSTVDSGNFLCCLTAVKEGLREYVGECALLNGIIERIEKLISETELTPLFNEKRKLFHIGIEPDSGKKSNSFYDLYMSEARMTAYFAVARREVSKKHWGALGRIYVGQGRFTGLASWTGTMFEYFMPNLFIPAPAGSLSSESLYFCLHCQRKRAGRLPFGISESGFYAFDGNLNYQYKAHGVQKLALKRGSGRETVVSPYSTFLALTEAPEASLSNLRRLEKLGMNGIYGFFEAIDFTKDRGSGKYSVIRSYMAHHVGMSMVAVNNMLNSRCMQRRFMNDSFMKGAESILEEKVNTDSRIFKDVKTESIPSVRERTHGKNVVSENPSPFLPETAILTNGRMTTVISDTGTGVTLFDGQDVTVNSSDPFMRPQGVFGVFAAENEVVPFVRALDCGSSVRFSSEFLRDGVYHTAECGNMFLKMHTSLLKKHNCELRKFTVENKSNKNNLKGKLIIYFEPCMEKREAYRSHPMFSKLFLTDEWDEENKCVLFSRRSSSDGAPYGMAAGIMEKTDFIHETSRERVLKSPFGIFSLGGLTNFGGERGNPECCCAFAIETDLAPKSKASFTLGIALAETKEQALNTFLAVKSGKGLKKKGENPFYKNMLENSFASDIMPKIMYPALSRGIMNVGDRCVYAKNDLWKFGISGENPIILIEAANEEDIGSVVPYIRINKKLRSCGIKTDLAIVFDGEDKYSFPVTNALKKIAENEDCGLMTGVNGGIHFINSELFDYREMAALKNTASFCSETEKKTDNLSKPDFRPLKFVDKKDENKSSKNASNVKIYNFTEGKIDIKKSSKTLDIPWTMVFANRSFGTMISDKALGFTWAVNSRENKLTPWYNDLMSDNRGEMLIWKYNNVLYDLISLGEAEFTPRSAVWKTEISGVEFRIEVSVAKRGMSKKCTVEITNKSGSARSSELMYFVVPVQGVSRDESGKFYAIKKKNGVVIENSFSPAKGFSFVSCNGCADYICLSKKDFFEGRFDSQSETLYEDCCVSIGKNAVLQKEETITAEFFLSWGATEKAAVNMPVVSDFGKELLSPVKIKSENKNLELFFNSFLYSQVKQSRFWGRTGFYQCSGAYGFRDQLQDCLAFLETEPQLAFTHIARCASVQFEEGDVLHWWHVLPEKGQRISGIRTKCSDDMLWLPYLCIEYCRKTNKTDILDVRTPYIKGETLSENEKERYFSPERTDYRDSVLNHCIKAVDKSLNFGKNGFPLIGSCDWNDGFSKVGESNAESVWLAMFQIMVLEGMSELCKKKELNEKADEYARIALNLRNTVEEKAWCGDRYARIILEDGSPLLKERDFIDILPQAFAVFAGIGKNGRSDIALTTAIHKLYDGKTVRLLSPAFEEEDRDSIGYIASYPCGIRENGGQYTHAAVWLAKALLISGRKEEGISLLNSINPMSFYECEKAAERYRAEPYVLAGDVSFGENINGRAGWTHFTGSASWFYSCICEHFSEMDCSVVSNGRKENSLYKSSKKRL